MSYTHIPKAELLPMLEKMKSYIDKSEKQNEAKKRKWLHNHAALTLCMWSWLPWMTHRRAIKKARAMFDSNLAGKTKKDYFFRQGTIEDARLILRRITQLAERDYNDVMVSDRHLDFLLNCNWQKV